MRLHPPSRSALAARSLVAPTSTTARAGAIHIPEDLHSLVGSDTEPLLSQFEKDERAREDDEESSGALIHNLIVPIIMLTGTYSIFSNSINHSLI